LNAADTVGRMVNVERLVTVVELDDRDQGGHSAWAHLYVVLSDGERLLLLDDRGWSTGAASIGQLGRRHIEHTARMVVDPDGPCRGGTDDQMEAWYWEWMERKVLDAGFAAEAAELKALPHDVEIGQRLRQHLAQSA
jgi:hypothetical protein